MFNRGLSNNQIGGRRTGRPFSILQSCSSTENHSGVIWRVVHRWLVIVTVDSCCRPIIMSQKGGLISARTDIETAGLLLSVFPRPALVRSWVTGQELVFWQCLIAAYTYLYVHVCTWVIFPDLHPLLWAQLRKGKMHTRKCVYWWSVTTQADQWYMMRSSFTETPSERVCVISPNRQANIVFASHWLDLLVLRLWFTNSLDLVVVFCFLRVDNAFLRAKLLFWRNMTAVRFTNPQVFSVGSQNQRPHRQSGETRNQRESVRFHSKTEQGRSEQNQS